MRILVAPDSYKLTLDSASAARVIADAARAVFGQAHVDECPVADGGEGTLAVWANATGAALTQVPACDVFGAPVVCPVATDPRTGIVLIEAAHTCGLPPRSRRDPDRSLSLGLGLVLRAVLEGDPDARIRIALGGTGTVDGGLGAALALGMRLEDAGAPFQPSGLLALPEEFRITFDNPFRDAPVFLCDTRVPLFGPGGAVPVFGPQKGVGPQRIPLYEAALERLMRAAARVTGRPFVDAPGLGAAGGIAALFSLLGSATCTSGAKYLLEVLRFEQRATLADLVVTGEGCLDATSFSGKIVGEIADVCRRVGRPLLILPGRCRLNPDRLPAHLVVRPTTTASAPEPESRPADSADPAAPANNMVKALLYDTAHFAFRDFSKKQLFPSGRFC